MIANRAFEPAGSPGSPPQDDPLAQQMDAMVDEGGGQGPRKAAPGPSPRANGTLGATADAGGEAMRSMAMDPVSATRQTFGLVRRHPYITALILLLFGAAIAGLSRS
jgi:hypothetical protein